MFDYGEYKKRNWKFKIKRFLQRLRLWKRDEQFFEEEMWVKHNKIQEKIIDETPWLAVLTSQGGQMQGLTEAEKAVKYLEYKHMIIERRAQYVIIFLTIVLLIMTGFQIYIEFFRKF